MRLTTILLCCLATTPVLAQSLQTRAGDRIAEHAEQSGFSAQDAFSIAACFSSHLTDAEATSVISAPDFASHQTAIGDMADRDAALGCIADAMG